LNETEREELLNQIDFSRVNEQTIAACKTNQLIPRQLIADAALALCVKLRKELEETQHRLTSIENRTLKPKINYPINTTSKLFSRNYHHLPLNVFRISFTSNRIIISYSDSYS